MASKLQRLLGSRGRAVEAAAFFAELVPGRAIGVWYDGDNVWHERLLLHPTSTSGLWVVRTPDGDVYEEQIDGTSPSDGPSRACLCDDQRYGPYQARGRFYRFAEGWADARLKG